VDDPCLPANALDMAIMVRTYHELEQPDALLRALKASLKPGAPVVIVDLDTEKTRHRDARSSTAEASIRSVAHSAGYEVVAVHTFLPDDTIFVLRASRGLATSGATVGLRSTGRAARAGLTTGRIDGSRGPCGQAICCMGNVAAWTGRKLTWDGETWRFREDKVSS